ncbi:hemolysin family protein [Phreatobacter sp.]|uniref:hemolysin family protein n=1 Tax=Phreatobacter sp. TaxID=1966341 RepID=UPI003F6FECD1
MPEPSDSRDRSPAAAAATPETRPGEGSRQAEGPPERPSERHERWIDRLKGLIGRRSGGAARRNIDDVLEETAPAAAGFTVEERSMLKNILELRESRVSDLSQPRADIMAVQKATSLAGLMQVFEEAGHTRLVVFDDTLDDPVGMVHIKDLVTYLFTEAKKAVRKRRTRAKAAASAANGSHEPARGEVLAALGLDLGAVDLATPLSATRLIRPILFVPPSMPAIDLLARMQATRIQLALVVDEYGGTDGLIAMEDIVEAIVGDIEDEHDVDDSKMIVAAAEGAFIADARTPLEDVREALGPSFDPQEEITDEVDTLGGYLTMLAGHVPIRGEVVPGPGDLEFEVTDADPRRVKRVRITRGPRRVDPAERTPRSRREAAAAALNAPAPLPPQPHQEGQPDARQDDASGPASGTSAGPATKPPPGSDRAA